MNFSVSDILNSDAYPIEQECFQKRCRQELDRQGVLVLPDFLSGCAVAELQTEGRANHDLAFFTADQHNIYLSPQDPDFPADHPRNRLVSSSKGCITTDQIPVSSPLRGLYQAPEFRQFLCSVLGETALYEYADPLSSINLHYASQGQELGWHFDNSSFAITLMIQKPEAGGVFEYVRDVRDADRREMNYEFAGRVLSGEVSADSLSMDAGTLVLFRGRNSMHRVTPVEGSVVRMLAVLAYNTEPGISLSESARMTFFGRLG